MFKIALFQPDIAGNVGTIMRSCACLDIELHIIEPCGFAFDMKKIKKSALDYIDYVKLFRHNSFDDFYQNQITNQPQNRLILLTTQAKTLYSDFAFSRDDILLLGRESAGVPDEIFDQSHFQIKIQMKNQMRSLNIAIAMAIVLGKMMA